MRSFLAATALVSGLVGTSWTGVSAREFTDPGSTWLLGSFHYDYTTLVTEGEGPSETFSRHVLQIEGRPAFFVAPRFFMGPSLRWVKSRTEDYSTSNLFAGGHAGLAFKTLATPIRPYIGLGFSFYHASSEYDGFDSGDSSTDGTQFQIFGGLLYQIDHLGIGLELAYARTNLEESHGSEVALRGTLSGLLF